MNRWVEASQESFITRNNVKFTTEQFLLETDTGLTKRGDGKNYYKNLPYLTVNVDSLGNPVSSGQTTQSVGGVQLTLISGAKDGSNTVFTWSGVPRLIIFNFMTYTNGAGFTLSGNTSTLDIAPNSDQSLVAFP